MTVDNAKLVCCKVLYSHVLSGGLLFKQSYGFISLGDTLPRAMRIKMETGGAFNLLIFSRSQH